MFSWKVFTRHDNFTQKIDCDVCDILLVWLTQEGSEFKNKHSQIIILTVHPKVVGGKWIVFRYHIPRG